MRYQISRKQRHTQPKLSVHVDKSFSTGADGINADDDSDCVPTVAINYTATLIQDKHRPHPMSLTTASFLNGIT